MLIKFSSKILMVSLLLLSGTTYADGGLIFLHKNQAAQEAAKNKVEQCQEADAQQTCK